MRQLLEELPDLSLLCLQTCYLNWYMHTVGLKDLPLSTCGEPESVKHYIDVDIREKLEVKTVFCHWQL